MKLDSQELLSFAREAIDYGWPQNTTVRKEGEFTNFNNTLYSRGQWRYIDLWSGSSTDAGVQIVFMADSPVWSCLYRGGLIDPADTADLSLDGNPVFGLLVEALRAERDSQLPIRGPRVFQRRGLTYRFMPKGDFSSFMAVETISDERGIRYERILIGGLFGDGVTYGRPLQGPPT